MLFFLFQLSITIFAFDTVPQETGDFSDVIYPSQNMTRSQTDASRADGILEITVGCYGTNLRSVGNPIAPNSKITAAFELKSSTLNVHFPGTLAARGNNGQASVSGLTGATVLTAGNKILVRIPNYVRQTEIRTISITDEGDVEETIDVVERDAMTFKSVRFTQTGVSGGQYYAKTGTVTNVSMNKRISNDGVIMQVSARFPGQNGFCGGYFSPIMAFFDDQRPTFKNISEFPIHKLAPRTRWPEAGAPGYFVAIDRDGNGKINKSSELFGSADGDKNGFESMKHLDANKDSVLDKKDPEFAKLLLWQDKNGNGISEKSEIIKFADKKIQSLSLGYENEIVSYGARAEEREQSSFKYLDKDSKVKSGALVDIWFAPVYDNKIANLKGR